MENEEIYKVAGMIIYSNSPGKTMKNIRLKLGITQKSLAELIGVSPSVLSDYESGRRRKPGTRFIRKYIDALVRSNSASAVVLAMHGGENIGLNDAIINIREYDKPVKASELIDLLEADMLTGEKMLDSPIYGHTVLDSIKTIITMRGEQFYKIFGKSSERALIFTKVGIGRSPMVAVRISPLKPRMVMMHGTQGVEKLAVEMASVENLILANIRIKQLDEVLRRLGGL
ncbi:MAG: helix-turn-helix domain-containing protein [Conexivisphaerales archaeon]